MPIRQQEQTPSPKPTDASSEGYEPCVVSFIDVLGFRALIKERPAWEVLNIIKSLERFARPAEEPPARSMDEVRLYSRAFAQSVSDAIVRVRPYGTQFRDGAFINEIIDLLHIQIELVNVGVFIRAGVTVGDAYVGISGEGPIFGPGMIRAYEIESQEAIFPRIVIDEHALEQHKLDRQLQAEHNSLEHETDMLGKLLAVGEDGTHYIDYLKAAFSEVDYPGSYLEFLIKHADLIRKGIAQKEDARTYRKYEWLRRYHNSRIDQMRSYVLSTAKMRSDFLVEYETDPEHFFGSVFV